MALALEARLAFITSKGVLRFRLDSPEKEKMEGFRALSEVEGERNLESWSFYRRGEKVYRRGEKEKEW